MWPCKAFHTGVGKILLPYTCQTLHAVPPLNEFTSRNCLQCNIVAAKDTMKLISEESLGQGFWGNAHMTCYVPQIMHAREMSALTSSAS